MFQLKVKFDDRTFKDHLRKKEMRLERIRESVGEEITRVVDEAIKKRVLRDESGWIDWYLNAMKWQSRSSDKTWGLSVDERIELDEIPEGRSLLYFKGAGFIVAFFNALNPWPLPRIPRLQDPYNSGFIVRPVSADEYKFHDRRIEAKRDEINAFLAERNISRGPRFLFRDELEVDVEFLVKRIEHGLGGFARQPHLRAIQRAAEGVVK